VFNRPIGRGRILRDASQFYIVYRDTKYQYDDCHE
jgi:hypothetical protein